MREKIYIIQYYVIGEEKHKMSDAWPRMVGKGLRDGGKGKGIPTPFWRNCSNTRKLYMQSIWRHQKYEKFQMVLQIFLQSSSLKLHDKRFSRFIEEFSIT